MAKEPGELEEVVDDTLDVLNRLLPYMVKEANRGMWLRKVLEIAENPMDMHQALTGILEVGIQEQKLGDSGSVFITLPAEGGEWELERLVKLSWADGIQRAVEVPAPPRKFTRKTGGLAWLVYESKGIISVSDCSRDERFVTFADGGRMRSFIGVPIRYQGEVLAVMCLHSREHTIEYSDPDKAFIEALARVASVTMIANHNDLTKLPNRLLMNYLLSREIDTAQQQQAELCLAYSDIDHFGQYNVKYGYNGADKLIGKWGTLFGKRWELTRSCVTDTVMNLPSSSGITRGHSQGKQWIKLGGT
jgi:GAF domain-containing protein